MGWPWGSEQDRHDKVQGRVISLVQAGETAQAEAVVGRALRRIHDPQLRATLLTAVTEQVIGRGSRPELLRETVGAVLTQADRELARAHRAKAGRLVGQALTIACHRSLHLQSVRSPLAEDPAGYFAALRDSAAARAVRAPRGRAATPASGPDSAPADRPTNVLLVTRQNANFLGELLHHLEASPRFQPRLLDLAEHEDLFRGVRGPGPMAAEILTGSAGAAKRVEAQLREQLDWADVVFVEWCAAHAVLVNLVDPRDTRVVLRLHSYEAFTPWPHLIDFSRVDDLLFVSDHVRDLVATAIPGVCEAPALRTHVLPLGLRLHRYVRPKPDDARFTLGLVGWRQVAKDPRWAVLVLRRLRESDDRYRLLLIGDEFDAEVSAATRAYGARLEAELGDLESEGAVRRTGRTEDVPGALTEVGAILSSSVRESFHAGLVEGAASGAIPVVRDWPFFAGRPHGARTLFPPGWVVDTPEQAAARILATTRDVEAWRRAGEAASAQALATWEWDWVKEGYERLLSR